MIKVTAITHAPEINSEAWWMEYTKEGLAQQKVLVQGSNAEDALECFNEEIRDKESLNSVIINLQERVEDLEYRIGNLEERILMERSV